MICKNSSRSFVLREFLAVYRDVKEFWHPFSALCKGLLIDISAKLWYHSLSEGRRQSSLEINAEM